MAGDSAREVARRQRETAAQLERSAAMWERGADGEATTAIALSLLESQGWTTFHDVRWPGRQRANIDHIAVGAGGVFVIDSKNWSGDIRVVDDVLYQAGRRREREVAAAADAALAVTEILHGFPATPVLCFVRPEPIDARARDVMVCSTQNLAAQLVSQPPVLGGDSLKRVTARLHQQLSSARRPVSFPSTPRPQRAQRGRRQPAPRGLTRPLVGACFGLLLLLGGGSLLVGILGAAAGGLGHTGRSGAEEQTASAPALGDVVRVEASQSHPALRLKADKVMRVRSTMPDYPLQHGHHLVAVRFTIRNEGSHLWGFGSPYMHFSALSSDGQHASQGSYAAVPRKKLLPAAFNLRPHHARRGIVVFSVPNGTKLVRVSLGTSYGIGDAAEWLIP